MNRKYIIYSTIFVTTGVLLYFFPKINVILSPLVLMLMLVYKNNIIDIIDDINVVNKKTNDNIITLNNNQKVISLDIESLNTRLKLIEALNEKQERKQNKIEGSIRPHKSHTNRQISRLLRKIN